MKLLVIGALFAVATADRFGSGGQPRTPAVRYGTSAGAQSQYGSPSPGHGLKSRRRPFKSTLKPLDGGYNQNTRYYGQNQNGYSSQSSGRYGSRSNGYDSESNGGYSTSSNGGYSTSSNGGYSTSSSGGDNQQTSARYTPRYIGTSGQPPSRGYGRPEPTPAPQPYSFSYDVLDVLGNDYGAAEESNGEQVQGQYSVLLPDGRLQTVSYSVQADSGFVADVRYEGEARFLAADGEEQGRSSVTRGAGPSGVHRYGDNQDKSFI